MRVPINWLKNYVKIGKDLDMLTYKLTMAGHMLDKKDSVDGNVVLDLELRGNRADCYSIVGIAREVAALFDTPLKYPKLYQKIKKASAIKNMSFKFDPKHVKRAAIARIKNIKITQSPKWLQQSLKAYGIASINNIVDLTNFVMVETGQPLHAFDNDKVQKTIEVGLAKKGEQITTFLGSKIALTPEDLVWKSKGQVISVAGAIGAQNPSVSDNTKTILVEAANYDRANIRRTIHRHNLLTDAGIRHEKELDPNLVRDGILRFLELIDQNGWGEIENELYDYYPNPLEPWEIDLNLEYLNNFSGTDIKLETVNNILERLSFKILRKSSNTIRVLCPTHRTDVKLEEDLVEEVLRILGYDQIPTKILSFEIPEDITPDYVSQEEEVKRNLIGCGFDEVISIPFVKEKYKKYNKDPISKSASPVNVQNRPSPDVEEMRMNLFPNLLENVEKIINERGIVAPLFEVGRVYHKKHKNNYVEKRKVGIAYWAKEKGSHPKFKGFLDAYFENFRLSDIKYQEFWAQDFGVTNAYTINLKGDPIGYGWQSEDIYYAEIDLDLTVGKSTSPKVNLWPKFPPQIEDVTFRLPEKTYLGHIIAELEKPKLVSKVELWDVYKDYYTFRIWYRHPQKTLSDKEVEVIRKKIIKMVKDKYGGVVK